MAWLQSTFIPWESLLYLVSKKLLVAGANWAWPLSLDAGRGRAIRSIITAGSGESTEMEGLCRGGPIGGVATKEGEVGLGEGP